MSNRLFGTNFLNSLITGQKLLDLFTIESTVRRNLRQRIAVPDIAPLRKIRMKEGLDDVILTTLLLGEPDEAMGIEGIRGLGNQVEGKLDPIRLAGLSHPIFHRLQRRGPAKFRLKVGAPIHPALRHRWIQLEGSPPDPNRLSEPDLFQRLFQPALADEAPRTNHVGIHIDVDSHVLLIH